MATAKKQSAEEQVAAHVARLEPGIRETVEAIRRIILDTDKTITEHIKWNNPAFYYNGDMKPFDPKEYKRDIAVFNLHKGRVMLVFPTGAVVNDSSGILEGDYKDGRRMVTLKNMDDVTAKEKALRLVIKTWLSLVDR